MCVNAFVNDRQPDSCPADRTALQALALEERLKDVIPILRRDPGAAVAHLEYQNIVIYTCRNCDFAVFGREWARANRVEVVRFVG